MQRNTPELINGKSIPEISHEIAKSWNALNQSDKKKWKEEADKMNAIER